MLTEWREVQNQSGFFEFTHVSPGDYILVYHNEGPTTGSSGPRGFYPGVPNIAGAQRIHIEDGWQLLTADIYIRGKCLWLRVTTDQAGMAYGLAGNLPKARAIFETAIAKDPQYPMYYYNLACADAEEKKLTDARDHLQQAFARKANVIRGETMPDPTKDDSFLPYRDNKEFWTFVESLH